MSRNKKDYAGLWIKCSTYEWWKWKQFWCSGPCLTSWSKLCAIRKLLAMFAYSLQQALNSPSFSVNTPL